MNRSVLFLSLRVFSITGGIEKVCRVMGKALYEKGVFNQHKVRICSLYDTPQDADDNKYFPSEIFKGFGLKRVAFISFAIRKSKEFDTILLSHVNLLPVGWLIKLIYPKKQLILLAHGIEIWKGLPVFKIKMLRRCDKIISVSNYTADVVVNKYFIAQQKSFVLNNCLDPFLPLGKEYQNNALLRNEFGFGRNEKIFFTLARISSKERYKGYDKVLEALAEIKKEDQNVRYIIAGNYDQEEKETILRKAQALGVDDITTLVGFVEDADLVKYFSMVDYYVMPSVKEGFGIVFIEALFYGLPVIAGDRDGSVDALLNGQLGLLVDPTNIDSIKQAMQAFLKNKNQYIPNRNILLEHFGYDHYKEKMESIVAN